MANVEETRADTISAVPIVRGGQASSGLDRALENAFDRELDDILESGEMWNGELAEFPLEDQARAVAPDRPWQFPIGSNRPEKESLWRDVRNALQRAIQRAKPAEEADRGLKSAPEKTSFEDSGGDGRVDSQSRPGDASPQTSAGRPADRAEASAEPAPAEAASSEDARAEAERARKRVTAERMAGRSAEARNFRFIEDRVGVVVIHGIGPQLAGKTLLDWTRPIIAFLAEWQAQNRTLITDPPDGIYLTDPVIKANIDFSGETFPVVQVHIPGVATFPTQDYRRLGRRLVFTEAWWAQEVRPPTLSTMITWLGSQGGVGRIVQGISEHTFGTGLGGTIVRESLRTVISVIVSFTLLIYLVLLAVAKLVPIGPLRDAAVLQLASSFLTDWFGGARTLLRDPAQSANVRTRLVNAVKALRSYGCREVMIIAHSGGTMVSYMTLTDPAYSRLRVQKLITIGEALNLAWRLENADPDSTTAPTPPEGSRLLGDLAVRQPTILWRDFWATNDPAPAGRPRLPVGVTDPGRRFLEERVWNRMSLSEDHGGYWDNDEQFVIPLIRELDVPTGDRAGSRFLSDDGESKLRDRRKQRVSVLALWRRVTYVLPVMAILAAATLTGGGILRDAGTLVLNAIGSVPGHEILYQIGTWLMGASGQLPGGLASWRGWYDLGWIVVQVVFLIAILYALVPAGVDRLWYGRWFERFVMLAVDWLVGLATLALVAWSVISAPHSQLQLNARLSGVVDGRPVPVALGLVILIWIASWVGPLVRGWSGKRKASDKRARQLGGALLKAFSTLVLAIILAALVVIAVAVVLVFAGNSDAGVEESASRRLLLIGSITVLLASRLVTRFGTWRWDSWDVRERTAIRRAPDAASDRRWPAFEAVVLAGLASLGAAVIAFGAHDWQWLGLDRNRWLFVFALGIVAVAMLGVARDVVESDTEVTAPLPAGPAAVEPPPAPAPGESRS
jgi:hypothetical protein